MYHIILDMDGVLSDSWDEIIESIHKTNLHGDTREKILRSHESYTRKRPQHARKSGMTAEKHAFISNGLSTMTNHLLTHVPPLFEEFVYELRILNARMAVVSAMSERYVKLQADRCGIPFTHILAWEDSPSKEDKVEKVCSDWGIPVSKVVYVTDTLADVYELETIMPREHIIGCAWGYCGYAVLREELPKEQILKNPKDIHKVLSDMTIQKQISTKP